MKKIFLATVLLFSIVLMGTVLAQEADGPVVNLPVGHIEAPLPELPNPGLKPGDFFYFLDMWGEAIGEFFTFNPETKVILQAERALERIAEVNALLEEKGVDAPGLDVAEAKIQRNIARANEILERQEARGVEVAQLAKRLELDFDVRRKLLNQAFDSRRDALAKQVDGIKTEIRRVRAGENLNRVSELRNALDDTRVQKDRLAERGYIFQDRIISENKRIREKMRERDREIRKLQEAKDMLEEEGERVVEQIFEQREMALETEEEVLEIQLNEAILVKDIALIEQIHSQLAVVELHVEVLEIEEAQFEEKMEVAEPVAEPVEVAVSITEPVMEFLEIIEDQEELKIMANKARAQAKEAIERVKAKAEEQNIEQNPTIMGLIKQAGRFHERALMLFEKGEYKKSYLASRKAIDFTGKAFKLITVKENLKKERPDLPVFPTGDIILPIEPIDPSVGPITPTPVDIIDPQVEPIDLSVEPIIPIPTPIDIIIPREISPERVKNEIKIAEQTIERTRSFVEYQDVEVIAFPVVVKLIEKAENNIDKAGDLLGQGTFNSAHRHAIEARGMAEEAYKFLWKKLQTGEIGIIVPPAEKEIRPRTIPCKTDRDCLGLICPEVIGRDTPQCGPGGICICGPGRDFEKTDEMLR